jgi:hydrogenase-4 transcriptional activator
LTNSQMEPLEPNPQAQAGFLLSSLRSTLSRFLSGMKDIAASDEQILEIYSGLQDLVIQLNKLDAIQPGKTPVALLGATAHAARQILTVPNHQFTYCSPKMQKLIERIERAAKRDFPILIKGETGVGKELISRFIHLSSSRSQAPLVPVNCAAIPRDLFENQFFGHKQGAFTGAMRDHTGIIRAASGGTLFLDEVGELPLDLQPKLLRFLQEGEIHPIGDSRPSMVDVRIVASTNRDLEAEVRNGRFRSDLLHRLNIISFEVPPLRERKEDIPLLLNFFLDKYCRLIGGFKVQFAPSAMDCLVAYSWPGNVRELNSLVLQLVSEVEEDAVLFSSDLPSEISGFGNLVANPYASSPDALEVPPHSIDGDWADVTLVEAVTVLERRKVQEALVRNNWNYSRAARQLGLSTYGLRKKYGRLFRDKVVTPSDSNPRSGS